MSVQAGFREHALILGCGGHGRVVLDILASGRAYDVVGFVDSDPSLTGTEVDGVPVLGRPVDLLRLRTEYAVRRAIVAVGDNTVRRTLARRLETLGYDLINAIHPSANLADSAELGRNIVVAAGALVCAHGRIGDSVILNTGCIVDHESHVAAGTHICPGAKLAGRVNVGTGAFVGIGATVIQNVRIGAQATVGAGAVVIADVASHSTVVGVPARPLRGILQSAELDTRKLQDLANVPVQTVPTHPIPIAETVALTSR